MDHRANIDGHRAQHGAPGQDEHAVLATAWRVRVGGGDDASLADSVNLFGERGDSAASDAALRAVAENAVAADLARVVLALQDDAGQLAKGVAARRAAQQRWPTRRGMGVALAASVVLAAVLLTSRAPLPGDVEVDTAATAEPTVSSDGRILAASFETDEAPVATAPARVFAGGFDS